MCVEEVMGKPTVIQNSMDEQRHALCRQSVEWIKPAFAQLVP
jgi:hypothetical protein